MKIATNCEECANYIYDDEYECYCCDINLDEDEMMKFISGTFYNCPYYNPYQQLLLFYQLLQL